MLSLPLLLYGAGVIVSGLALVFVGLPIVLAFLEGWKRGNGKMSSKKTYSRLCVGQVWHTRLQPKRHAFSYPIFMFALDLEEMDQTFSSFLWPIVRFAALRDHLKNGEGTPKNNMKKQDKSTTPSLVLADRLLRLVAERTQNKFQPTLETHRIMLMTHLEYYGYNFNPVSFYYIINKETAKIDGMVGEVSNTPWTEMYCYVLHRDSLDQVQLQSGNRGIPQVENKTIETLDYRFPKAFHVSPFMEMEYWYDWTFQGTPGIHDGKNGDELLIINSLRQRPVDISGKDEATKEAFQEELAFTAKLKVKAEEITPWGVAWQLIRFPIFCFLIQIWIHYEALWLFLKGIVYVPHPEGSETAASQAIAAVMTPFFAIRDRLNPKSKTA